MHLSRIKLGIVALVPLAYLLAMPSFIRKVFLSKLVLGSSMLAILVCALSMPNITFAAVITSQTNKSTAQIPASADISQYIGTGSLFTGTGLSVLISMKGSYNGYLALYACDGVNADGTMNGQTCSGAGNNSSNSNQATANQAEYTFTWPSEVLNTSKHYFIVFVSSLAGTTIYGSSTDSFSNGKCFYNTSWTACADTLDLYFIAFGNANYINQGITSINNPIYGQVVTSGNNVNFNFDYYINSLDYDKAGFTLTDITAGQNIDTSSLEEPINASGASEFNAYFDLITGHNYIWTPYLRLSTSSSTPLYGQPTGFFTGTNQSTPLPPRVYNPWASSTLISSPSISTSTGIYSFNGTSTNSWFAGILDPATEQLLASKFPFSYIYDFKTLFLEIANGNATSSHSCSNSDAYYTLPTGTLGSVLSNGSTSVKIIDACAVRDFSITQEIRKMVGYTIYIMTAFGLVGMAMSIF